MNDVQLCFLRDNNFNMSKPFPYQGELTRKIRYKNTCPAPMFNSIADMVIDLGETDYNQLIKLI